MIKSLGKISAVFVMIVLAAGCRTTKDVSVHGYIQAKERVDQDVRGSVGNWQNAPDAVDVERKPTRKVYVLEISKEAKIDDSLFEHAPTTDTPTTDVETEYTPPVKNPYEAPSVRLPSTPSRVQTSPAMQDSPKSAPMPAGGPTDYKVEKDDTLQKISKKFYNTYNQWPRIYEANKEKIPNPDFLQPGITLQIPAKE